MRKAVLAAGVTAAMAGALPAMAQQAGAPVAAATQPGAWGPQGWQAGAAPVAQPAYAAAPVPTANATAPAGYLTPAPTSTQPVPPQVYSSIERGRKVKGPALANTVADPAAWGLPQPGPAMRWIRYYDDAVLIDAKDRAVDIRSVPWDMPRQAQQPVYAQQPYGYPMPQQPMRAPGTYHERHGDTVVTTTVLAPPAMPGAYYGGYGQVVSVVPGTITTTTRTYWVRSRPSRRHRAHR